MPRTGIDRRVHIALHGGNVSVSIARRLSRRVLRVIERHDRGFRSSLRYYHGARGPHGQPDAPWANRCLRTQAELDDCLAQIRDLGLPPMLDAPKNWDSLCALDHILKTTTAETPVLDAGAARWSMILPWLFLYGYRNLTAINLEFDASFHRGPIRYLPMDITATDFAEASFGAVTCLSVIEHGVDADAFFREMRRIVVPGGHLIVSTDYFDPQVATGDRIAYGAPIHIFSRADAVSTIAAAERHGWLPISPVDLGCEEKVVIWKEFDLRFTFLVVILRKMIP
jgi:SAM-dependent methyltransferase